MSVRFGDHECYEVLEKITRRSKVPSEKPAGLKRRSYCRGTVEKPGRTHRRERRGRCGMLPRIVLELSMMMMRRISVLSVMLLGISRKLLVCVGLSGSSRGCRRPLIGPVSVDLQHRLTNQGRLSLDVRAVSPAAAGSAARKVSADLESITHRRRGLSTLLGLAGARGSMSPAVLR